MPLGPKPVLGITIYAEADGHVLRAEPADEKGFEGVACVDDAARAACLFLDAWKNHGFADGRQAAEGFLRFVCHLQHESGGFYNFVLNWKGEVNRNGATSRLGGQAWTARGLQALAKAAVTLETPEYRERFERCLEHERRPMEYTEIRALHVLAVLDLYQHTQDTRYARLLGEWADEIADCRDERGRLLNRRDQTEIHLWGRDQPRALALAGLALDRPSLVDVAVTDARLVLAPCVRAGFSRARTRVTFEVTSTISALSALWQATRDWEFLDLLHQARAWLRGRNPAGMPVYDPGKGMVFDGVDEGRVSTNSGAEANIEGAMALMDELNWSLHSFPIPTPARQPHLHADHHEDRRIVAVHPRHTTRVPR